MQIIHTISELRHCVAAPSRISLIPGTITWLCMS